MSAAFDTYGASGTTTTLTISREDQPTVTKHGLNLVARYQMNEVPSLTKMIVVGSQAETIAAEDIGQWKQLSNNTELLLLHNHMQGRFAMNPAFEDLVKQEDVMTAKFAAKRLEYRATVHLNLEGAPSLRNRLGYPLFLLCSHC